MGGGHRVLRSDASRGMDTGTPSPRFVWGVPRGSNITGGWIWFKCGPNLWRFFQNIFHWEHDVIHPWVVKGHPVSKAIWYAGNSGNIYISSWNFLVSLKSHASFQPFFLASLHCMFHWSAIATIRTIPKESESIPNIIGWLVWNRFQTISISVTSTILPNENIFRACWASCGLPRCNFERKRRKECCSLVQAFCSCLKSHFSGWKCETWHVEIWLSRTGECPQPWMLSGFRIRVFSFSWPRRKFGHLYSYCILY